MQLKKSILVGTLLSLASISMAVNASLKTKNYTHEDSSVLVTFEDENKKPRCSSEAGVSTPRMNADGTPGESNVKDNEITLLCLGSKNNRCNADIFSNNNCSGVRVGYASLNLRTKSVTSITSTNPRYVFTVDGSGTLLTVEYAK